MEIDMNPLQKQMLDDVFDAFTMLSGGNFVSLMHVDGGVTRYTQGAVELFGLPGEYIPNGAMDWNDYLHPEDRKRYMDVMVPLSNGETQTYDITYRVRTVKGEYANFRAVGAVLRGNDGRPSLIGGALINQGVTENTDPVTVLPNMNSYREDLAKMMNEGKSTISLQVGISKFSEVNEIYGYSHGNRVLQEVAWMIQEIVKDRGNVYRLNGASFAILSDRLTRDEAAAIYDNIRYRFQRGVQTGGIKNILDSNGGLISTYGSEINAGTICSCLNYAYSESKKRLHGELVDFNGSINYEGTKSLELISTIRDCAADGCKGFSLEYLPVIDAGTGEVKGAEAIIYWEDEQGGKVGSEDFIPVLEKDFIFEEIGDFILEKGLSDGVRFLEKDPGFLLCLNVYRIQLESDYFIDNLMHYLKETGFPSKLLSLKFASDCRFIRMGRMKEIIAKLHEKGILVIIGDFGSGTDSIGFLRSEPVDAVSIDNQFTTDIKNDEKSKSTLKHLAEMAHDYVDHINVKGVDSEELRDVMKLIPVSTMQGDYFSKPLSFDAMVEKYYS